MGWKATAREDGGKDIACTPFGQMATAIGSIRSRTDSRGTLDSVTVTLRAKCRDANPVTRRAVCPVIPASPLSRQQNARPFLSALGIVNGMGRWVMGNGLMTATH